MPHSVRYFAAGDFLGDVASGGNVVGGDEISKQGEDARIGNVRGGWFNRQKGRFPDIGGVWLPVKCWAFGYFNIIPFRSILVNIGICICIDGRIGCVGHEDVKFRRLGPQVAQEYGLAVLTCSEGLVVEIDVHASGEGKGHDKRRRAQIIGLA